MVLVRFRKHGLEYVADIVAKSEVEGRPEGSIYEGKLPQLQLPHDVKPVWLTTNARADVARALSDNGLEPSDYIQEATVHGRWKLRHHQGVVYVKALFVEVEDEW